MSQPKNAEAAAAARRVPSTYASKGIGPEFDKSGDVLQSAISCDFETVFEGATLRLKEEQRYRTFVDLERIAGRFAWSSSLRSGALSKPPLRRSPRRSRASTRPMIAPGRDQTRWNHHPDTAQKGSTTA
jgi:hypothetical protein